MTAPSVSGGFADSLERLPDGIRVLLRSELPSLADGIVDEIQRCVPELAPVLRGGARAQVRGGVERGLGQFVDQIGGPRPPRERAVKLYRALGRGEYVAGRSMDGLQAAFRVGARVAWHCYAQVGQRAGLPPETMCVLAEAVFAHVEEVAAHSAGGYADVRAQATGDVQRRRRRLLELLLADPPVASPGRLSELARECAWRIPGSIAGVALDQDWHATHLVSPAVGPDVLMDLERPDPYLLVPDPDGPGRAEMLQRAFGETRYAVGPSMRIADAALSLRLARHTLSLAQRSVIDNEGPLRCEDHLATLLLMQDERVMRLLVERRLRPFDDVTPANRARLIETLQAWLATGGRITDMAARLHLHPQTVRYRMRRLGEMFGDRLRDADWRFEMELVLRSRLLLAIDESEAMIAKAP